MATRSPSIAPWIFNLTTWVNSHWQQHDIFNRTDGDPTVVANRVSAIASRFGIATDALALHWCVENEQSERVGRGAKREIHFFFAIKSCLILYFNFSFWLLHLCQVRVGYAGV